MASSRYRPSRGLREIRPGIWAVRVRVTDPRTGRTRDTERRLAAGNWEEAAEQRDRLARDLTRPKRRGERTTLDAYAASWLERRAAMVRPSTASTYADRAALLLAWFGGWYIDQITAGDLEDWMGRQLRKRRPLSAATINGCLALLGRIMRDAARDHVGVADPTRGVRRMPVGATKGRRGTSLDLDGFRALVTTLEARNDDVGRALLVLAWTGARAGEVLELRWTDWDRDAGELRIERAVWRGSVGATKTDDPRIVSDAPIAAALQAQLDWLERGYVAAKGEAPGTHPGRFSGLMFPASPGRASEGARRRGGAVRWHRSVTALAKPLERARVEAGLPPISLHSLRRTWARLAEQAGVSEAVRMAQAGWRSDDARLIYEGRGVSRDKLRDAGAAMVRLVGGDR